MATVSHGYGAGVTFASHDAFDDENGPMRDDISSHYDDHPIPMKAASNESTMSTMSTMSTNTSCSSDSMDSSSYSSSSSTSGSSLASAREAPPPPLADTTPTHDHEKLRAVFAAGGSVTAHHDDDDDDDEDDEDGHDHGPVASTLGHGGTGNVQVDTRAADERTAAAAALSGLLGLKNSLSHSLSAPANKTKHEAVGSRASLLPFTGNEFAEGRAAFAMSTQSATRLSKPLKAAASKRTTRNWQPTTPLDAKLLKLFPKHVLRSGKKEFKQCRDAVKNLTDAQKQRLRQLRRRELSCVYADAQRKKKEQAMQQSQGQLQEVADVNDQLIQANEALQQEVASLKHQLLATDVLRQEVASLRAELARAS